MKVSLGLIALLLVGCASTQKDRGPAAEGGMESILETERTCVVQKADYLGLQPGAVSKRMSKPLLWQYVKIGSFHFRNPPGANPPVPTDWLYIGELKLKKQEPSRLVYRGEGQGANGLIIGQVTIEPRDGDPREVSVRFERIENGTTKYFEANCGPRP